jgi:hypothetical protein
MSTTPQQPSYIIPPPQAPNWKTPLLIGAFLLLVIFNVFLYFQVEHLRNETKADLAKLSSDLSATVEQIRIDSSASVRQATKRVQAMQEQLEEQRLAADRAVGQAKIDAQRKVELLQKQVSTEQAKQQQAIDQVKLTADTASTKLNDVSTDVGNVKTDLGSTKSQLEQTIANLKRVTGDGDIMVQLKKADTKRNRYTLEVLADDKTVEKKDRTINEPVQFYTGKARQPSEIVVNEVRKDTIVGYLAEPKVQVAR